MAAAMVGDSNLEKMLSAEISEIVHKMSPSSSANNKKVPSPFYSEDSSSEDEWGEDAEVEVEIKEKEDNSAVKRLSRYSLGYYDFSDHQEGRVEKTLWYKLMVKHNNIIPKNRPPPPPPPPQPTPPPPPRRLRAFMRYAQDPTSSDDEEELDKLLSDWGWTPGGLMNYAALSTTTGTSHPDITV
ncbi:hypothetical protein Tco_0247684 [Tanacetum coccineum]